MEKYLNFINNQWVAADDGASISVSNPATEEMVGLVSAASAGQAVHACDVAAAAQRVLDLAGHRRVNTLHVGRGTQHAVDIAPAAAGSDQCLGTRVGGDLGHQAGLIVGPWCKARLHALRVEHAGLVDHVALLDA